MAHFAKVNDEGIVEDVIVLDNSSMLDSEGVEQEAIGVAFLSELFEGTFIQTSYNSNFRGRFAGVGGTYDKDLDEFIVRKPFDSWVLVKGSWEAPVPKPTVEEDAFGFETTTCIWNEESLSWEVQDTVKAHYAKYLDSDAFEGTIVSMPVEYILDDQGNEDDELGRILAIDYKGPGRYDRVHAPV